MIKNYITSNFLTYLLF